MLLLQMIDMGSGPSYMCNEGIRGTGMGNNARLIRGAHVTCEHSERDDSSRGGRHVGCLGCFLGLKTYIALKKVPYLIRCVGTLLK